MEHGVCCTVEQVVCAMDHVVCAMQHVVCAANMSFGPLVSLTGLPPHGLVTLPG